MTYITGAIYPSGDRIRIGAPEEETLNAYQQPNTAVALGYANPDIHELHALQETFNLHELALEDASHGHQRAKLESYEGSLFAVVRPAIYLDAEEEVRLGEMHMFLGRDYLLSIVNDQIHPQQAVYELFNLIYATPDGSPIRLLHRIIDQTVDGYMPVLEGLENDGDEIENVLFQETGAGDRTLSRRTYELLNQVADFQRACKPLDMMLARIMQQIRDGVLDVSPYTGATATEIAQEKDELQRQFRNIQDHVVQVKERLEDLRTSLQNTLTVHDTIVAQQQNEDMKRISAGAAILVVPTIIGSIYGMNFEDMPELKWTYGYPASLVLMVVACVVVYLFFKKRGWF